MQSNKSVCWKIFYHASTLRRKNRKLLQLESARRTLVPTSRTATQSLAFDAIIGRMWPFECRKKRSKWVRKRNRTRIRSRFQSLPTKRSVRKSSDNEDRKFSKSRVSRRHQNAGQCRADGKRRRQICAMRVRVRMSSFHPVRQCTTEPDSRSSSFPGTFPVFPCQKCKFVLLSSLK